MNYGLFAVSNRFNASDFFTGYFKRHSVYNHPIVGLLKCESWATSGRCCTSLFLPSQSHDSSTCILFGTNSQTREFATYLQTLLPSFFMLELGRQYHDGLGLNQIHTISFHKQNMRSAAPSPPRTLIYQGLAVFGLSACIPSNVLPHPPRVRSAAPVNSTPPALVLSALFCCRENIFFIPLNVSVSFFIVTSFKLFK